MKFIFLFVSVFVGIFSASDSIQDQLCALETRYGVLLGEGVTLQPEEYADLAYGDTVKYPKYAQNDGFLRLCAARIIVDSRYMFLADSMKKEGPVAQFLTLSIMRRLVQLDTEIKQLYSQLK